MQTPPGAGGGWVGGAGGGGANGGRGGEGGGLLISMDQCLKNRKRPNKKKYVLVRL